jgi:hypothetical protein
VNHNALLQFIRLTCDHWCEYNDATQQELLTAVFWLADVIVEDLKARPDHRQYEHAISEIQLMQDFSEGVGESDRATAFRHIGECGLKAIPLPDES